MAEPRAAELGLAGLPRERQRWLEVMVANPVLIQRPLITADDGTTVIGRTEAAVGLALSAESDTA